MHFIFLAAEKMEVEGEPEVKKRYKKFDLVVVTESFGLTKDMLKAGTYVCSIFALTFSLRIKKDF